MGGICCLFPRVERGLLGDDLVWHISGYIYDIYGLLLKGFA